MPAALDSVAVRKARGAFFTPPEVCDFIAAWAVRSPTDRVFEPSCGEAAFLLSARLRSLGTLIPDLNGVEFHAPSAAAAHELLTADGLSAPIEVADFFDVDHRRRFDAVVGNPPFVRYQDFAGSARLKAQKRLLALGVPMSGLASSWAAFAVQAAHLVAPGGRLGLVLPAELLSVNYAAPVRRELMRRFESVRLVMFEERVFPDVSEEVVLLLAEGQGPTDRFVVQQFTNAEDLRPDRVELPATRTSWRPDSTDAKWSPALLPAGVADQYRSAMSSGLIQPLESWGDSYLGAVTGNIRFFTLTADEARPAGLDDADLREVSPPGSRHLRGLTFTNSAWKEMRNNGARALLFYPDAEPSPAARRYIELGELEGVSTGYKCRTRKPWWRVPIVATPHLYLTYMNHDAPRLVRNSAKALHLNSIHGVKLRPGLVADGQDLLPIAALNSLTVLGSEIVGRSYGGGILKLEPKEADALPLPSPEIVRAATDQLRAIRPQLGPALRGGALEEAIKLVDRFILRDGLGLKHAEVSDLRAARIRLFERRQNRR